MHRWKRWIDDRIAQAGPSGRADDAAERGSASLEFITIGLILLVPLVYLVLTMSALQSAAFATEGAARQAVRVYVQAENEGEAAARAERAIRFALADAGLDGMEPTVSVTCSPDPAHCLTRLGTVTITVALTVPLPLVPAFLSLDVPMGMPMEATATEQVSRFWRAG